MSTVSTGATDDPTAASPQASFDHDMAVAETQRPAPRANLPTDTVPHDMPGIAHATSTAGGRIDRYVLLRQLGSGGMGVVYAAYDPKLDRKVALKLLHPGLSSSEDARRRLEREARALAKLSHANVVQVHDVGSDGATVFIAMEFVPGKSLRAFTRDTPTPGWQRVLSAYLEAGKGLIAAHDNGLIHRDFKPANVLMDASGRVKVADFGLAMPHRMTTSDTESDATDGDTDVNARDTAIPERRDQGREPLDARDTSANGDTSNIRDRATWHDVRLTTTGVIMGTPAYMAPEQHEHADVTASVDVYAFCVSLYEGLYGRLPFDASPAHGGGRTQKPERCAARRQARGALSRRHQHGCSRLAETRAAPRDGRRSSP